jgi:hypothetical protein
MSVTILAVMAIYQARRKFIELHLEFSASHYLDSICYDDLL